jgi:hypothetical protein
MTPIGKTQTPVRRGASAAGWVLGVLRGLDLRRRAATRVLVIDLHDLLARRLVAGLRLRGWWRSGGLSLSAAHSPTVHLAHCRLIRT